MATQYGLPSDMSIYNEQIVGGYIEAIAQNLDAFNAASNGTITLVDNASTGDYKYESFFADVANIVTRRDETSTSDADGVKLTQDENITVKVNRKFGPIRTALAALRKQGLDMEAASVVLGQKFAEAQLQDMLNTAITAGVAALSQTTGSQDLILDVSDNSSNNGVNHGNLNSALAKFGDASGNIAAFVMQGKAFHDLIGASITDNIFQVGGAAIIAGTPATFNRPVIVVDAPALREQVGSTSDYDTVILGLTTSGLTVEQSEVPYFHTDVEGGKENLIHLVQAEYAYNVGVKGFKWDTANGGVNPNDSAIGTGANWDSNASNDKLKAGVVLRALEA